MDKNKFLAESHNNIQENYDAFSAVVKELSDGFQQKYQRLLPLGDLFIDRWEKGRRIGAGEGSNIYDSVLILGEVKMGKECWVGPQVVLDGSGGLEIGDYCTLSAGVQIYTHDNVRQTLSSKRLPIERKPTKIGNNVYISPYAVITKGLHIGNEVVIGSYAFVNKDVPDRSIVMGQPAKVVGTIRFEDQEITFNYDR